MTVFSRDKSFSRRGMGTIVFMIVIAAVLIAATGCSSGSDESEPPLTRESRSRTTETDHSATASTSSGHDAALATDQALAASTGHDEPAQSDHSAAADSDQAITISLTTTSSDSSDHAVESSHDVAADDGDSDHGSTEEAGSGPAHWEYTGGVGQNYWGLLEDDFNSCVDGSAQSPIDIRDTLVSDLQDISFHYKPATLVVSNNGHTIQASYGKTDHGHGGYMIVDGQEFELLQFHFHRPSEHTVNGHQAAMEMHLVHAAADGTLAVVGVLIEPGAFNSSLEPIWDVMPHTAGDEVVMETVVDVYELLPQDRRTYRYPGSLTTPPCSEGVKWNLMKTPISVSSGQVDAFKDLYFFNARYTQPLNGRVILEDATVGK